MSKVLWPTAEVDKKTKDRRRLFGSEHYYALLRRLQISGDGSLGHLASAIGITSCRRREGVTTVAANLAMAASDVVPGRVLLVDANVSRPSVGRLFKAKRNADYLDVLVGQKPVFDCIVESRLPNLSLLLMNRPTKKPQKLAYDVVSIDEMLDALKHVFQLIIFDLPPVLSSTACCSLAGRLDGVILVAGPRLRRDVASQARKHLSDVNAQIIGAVYNKAPHSFGGSF